MHPRTDSRYITGDMEQAILKLIQKTAQPVCGMDGESVPAAGKLVNDATPQKRGRKSGHLL